MNPITQEKRLCERASATHREVTLNAYEVGAVILLSVALASVGV